MRWGTINILLIMLMTLFLMSQRRVHYYTLLSLIMLRTILRGSSDDDGVGNDLSKYDHGNGGDINWKWKTMTLGPETNDLKSEEMKRHNSIIDNVNDTITEGESKTALSLTMLNLRFLEVPVILMGRYDGKCNHRNET